MIKYLRSFTFLGIFAAQVLPAVNASSQTPAAPAISFNNSYSSGTINYLSADGLITIALPVTAPGTTVYYVVDENPEEATNPFIYGQPFTLPEGAHSLYARAVQADVPSDISSAAIHVCPV